MTKTLRQTCTCKNCGNEAEMEITCSWSDFEQARQNKEAATGTETADGTENRIKGTGVCTSCGNEADMWVDI